MPQINRLKEGGLIDRNTPIDFTFNGIWLTAYDGDTIASALLANGIDVVSRSLKFHRPRGIMTAGVEEPNAFVSVVDQYGAVPIACASATRIHNGDEIRSLNGLPSLKFDLLRILDVSHKLWTAGFYNKTFKWPGWNWYEGSIRATAGIGKLRGEADTTRYYRGNLHCDLLVVGSGPSGLSAALAAAPSGARIVIVEQDFQLGGSLLASGSNIDGIPASHWATEVQQRLESADNVTILTASTACGYYDHNILMVCDRSSIGIERTWTVRASNVILATGAIEQPALFPYNDRPGIMLSRSVLTFLRRFAVRTARSVAISTNNDSAYETAFALGQQGIEVPAIVDSRKEVSTEMLDTADQYQIPVFVSGSLVSTSGRRRLSGISFRVGKKGQVQRIACDGLAVSAGFNPTAHLFTQAGGRLRFDRHLAAFVPEYCRQRVSVVGAATGTYSLSDALAEGSQAAMETLSPAGLNCNPRTFVTSSGYSGEPGDSRIDTEIKPFRQWVDHFHDVTVSDIALAHAEGFRSAEHLKRYTTVGMALDQGKTSNSNATRVAAKLRNCPINEFGTTTFRPMYTPTSLGAIAGQYRGALYHPKRRLAAADWHSARGAVLGRYGEWQRPDYYLENGESEDIAVAREVLSVRRSVGVVDASPLCKIELIGPQAGEFLNRLFVNEISTLVPGRIRYGIMLDENGVIFDDAVAARLSEHHYLLQSTSSNASNMLPWLERWHQCEWPDLELLILPVSTQWSVATVSGPEVFHILSSIDTDISFDQLAPMTITEGKIADSPARVQRTRYTGETTFEIAVHSDNVVLLLDSIAGTDNTRARIIGLKAMDILRIEMGRLHIGTDTDGTTNANDIGWRKIAAARDTDFVGRRSWLRPADQCLDRRQLVGIVQIDHGIKFEAGTHFVVDRTASRSAGFVTSACLSPAFKRQVGLGILEGGSQKLGQTVTLYNNGETGEALICAPGAYESHVQRT